MPLDREIDIIKRTKQYMDEIASFGVNNIDRMDKTFQSKLEKNIEELRRIGFVHISHMLERLVETKDIKIYVRIEFILIEMQKSIWKKKICV
jgi:transcriptional regulatory protein LevR